jgi:hypothetical protein
MTSDGGENSKHKMVFEKSGVDQRAPWLNVPRLPLHYETNPVLYIGLYTEIYEY